jgi:amidase
MNRRQFLGTSSAAAAAAAAVPATFSLGLAAPGNRRDTHSPSPGPYQPRPFALEEVTLTQLQHGLAAGAHSSLSLTRAYLRRIEELDRQGPTLRSVMELNPDAEAIARQLDSERKAGRVRGPLHGIPVLVKDNLDTHDRMVTSAGSLALEQSRPLQDSFVVARLREAGAVLLGKTNLSEWANFRGSNSISGWSGRGGLTRNPYVLDRNPSGSSSGTGAAVSANLCAVGIGTETDGSILSPSNVNGLVGVKPTVGLVSRAGIVPISASQDTAGPMCRSVRDAAVVLGVMAGRDPRDPATSAIPSDLSLDFAAGLDSQGLRGARLGVVREFFSFHPAVERLMNGVLDHLRELGAELIDPVELPGAAARDRAEFEVLLYEFKDGLNTYLRGLPASVPVRSLADVIAFNEAHRDRELAWFGQETMIKAEARGPLTEAAYREAVATCRRVSRMEGIDAVMARHRLDALIAPTGGPAWMTDTLTGDSGIGGSTSPAAVAGYPSVTVPATLWRGLPLGLSFFGTAWSEARLLRLAHAFEMAVGARRPPRFYPTLPL